VADPFRPYITHAAGARKWDVDGNEYIDYTMGHGALILGHSHPAVVSAVSEQASKGFHYGDNHELEVRWAAASFASGTVTTAGPMNCPLWANRVA